MEHGEAAGALLWVVVLLVQVLLPLQLLVLTAPSGAQFAREAWLAHAAERYLVFLRYSS